MERIKQVFIGLILPLALAADPALAGDPPSVHGMLLVGAEHVFVSHLPMFHRPHDYQAILEVRLGGDARAVYVHDRATSGEKIYTIVPRPFVLPDVVRNLTPFQADIYRGHFERGGTLILPAVAFEIVNVVHFRKFAPGAAHPADGLEYLIFGGGPSELFAAHLITARPDFDQVLSVKAGEAFPAAALAGGISIRLPGRPFAAPLQEGESVSAVPAGASAPLPLEAGTEYYRETGDLE